MAIYYCNGSGYDRIQNVLTHLALTDENGYADMTFGTVTAGTGMEVLLQGTFRFRYCTLVWNTNI